MPLALQACRDAMPISHNTPVRSERRFGHFLLKTLLVSWITDETALFMPNILFFLSIL
jgi:hypothetical protein